MDSTTRRITGIGLALTVVATVYAVNGDLLQAALAAGGAAACLLWGYWPDIQRKRNPLVDGDAVDVSVVRADLLPEGKPENGERLKDVLSLQLLVSARNTSDHAVTIRPTDLQLIRSDTLLPILAEFYPIEGIDPMGRIADYSHFPEGQHTIPPRTERAHYFFFQAVSQEGAEVFLDPDMRLRLTISMPGPHSNPRLTVPLPPIKRR